MCKNLKREKLYQNGSNKFCCVLTLCISVAFIVALIFLLCLKCCGFFDYNDNTTMDKFNCISYLIKCFSIIIVVCTIVICFTIVILKIIDHYCHIQDTSFDKKLIAEIMNQEKRSSANIYKMVGDLNTDNSHINVDMVMKIINENEIDNEGEKDNK